jgi:putative peptide zinc metalloprotease protein
MYFQLLLSGILVLVYALTTNEWMLYASLINIISFLPNLNPFVRYDGYWILSDGLGINNLMQKAAKSYRQTIVWIRNKMTGESPVKTATGKFLVAYYVANKIMVLVFLLVFVVFNGHAVLYFPYRLLHIIYSLVMKQEALSFNGIKTFITGNLVSILFYILLGRLIKNSSLRKGQAHRQWSVTNKKTIVKTDTMG